MKEELIQILKSIDKKEKTLETGEKEIIELFEKTLLDERFTLNNCLSYRHDFGLLSEQEKEKIIFSYKEWVRAIINNLPYHK